jgi:acetyl esterase/lipase
MLDASAFSAAAISAETRQLGESVEKFLAGEPPITKFEPARLRAAREQGSGVWGAVRRVDAARTREIRGPRGPIGLRVFHPPERPARGVYLHFHGGGWTLGAAHHHDVANWALCRHQDVAVVSVDYRLAPEDPYPAGPDDCEAAALWLLEEGRRELGSGHFAIGGESAGANLALVTLLRLRDRHGVSAFRGANLVYGAYDLGLTPSARRWGARNLILSTPILEWFRAHYLPDPSLHGDPDVSPLLADLRGLPPAHLTVGTLDPLLDDTLFLHARWLAAGNRASLFVAPGGLHGFDAFPGELARAARAASEGFVGRVLAA